MVEIQGYCEEKFTAVKEAFRDNFSHSTEIGASFAATLNGRLVVDIWGGYKDAACTQPWEENTIVNVYSTTKIMAALCLHILIDRGQVNLDSPVAAYWPEFAQAGKENVLIRHILSHTSGITRFDEKLKVSDLYDWDRMCRLLASEKPWWIPGTKAGYQMITYSFLVGNLVKLVSGKTLGTFFKDEVADPFNIDFFIGTPERHHGRIAELQGHDISKFLKLIASIFVPRIAKVVFNPDPNELMRSHNSKEWRCAELPSSNGHGNARSVAEVGAILACGGIYKGHRILSQSTIEEAIKPQIIGIDQTTTVKAKFGLGWEIDPKFAVGPRSFSWGGYGGSLLVMDADLKASAGYAMNYLYPILKPDSRAQRLMKAFRKLL